MPICFPSFASACHCVGAFPPLGLVCDKHILYFGCKHIYYFCRSCQWLLMAVALVWDVAPAQVVAAASRQVCMIEVLKPVMEGFTEFQTGLLLYFHKHSLQHCSCVGLCVKHETNVQTEPCLFFKEGRCSKGEQCTYIHDEADRVKVATAAPAVSAHQRCNCVLQKRYS